MSKPANPSLKLGVYAYNKGDYETAIAHLAPICQTTESGMTRTKAQLTLVKAYQKTGQIEAAIALCEDCLNNPLYEQWARKTLKELGQSESKPEESQKEAHNSSNNLDNLELEQDSPESDHSSPRVAILKPSQRQWRNGGRLETPKNLKNPASLRLFWVLMASVIALFWVFQLTVTIAVCGVNQLINFLSPWIPSLSKLYIYHTRFSYILAPLVLIFLLSPWLLTLILKQWYRLQPFSLTQLEAYSPESVNILREYQESKKIKQIRLRLVFLDAPVIFSYGYLPRNATIVVSRGLLQQLDDEEIATLYALQLGQIGFFDFPWISAMMGLLQLPLCVYQQLSHWGENTLPPILRSIPLGVATLFYGVYRLWRLPILWLSRQRIYYHDHYAVNVTGNPNGLSRALVKIAIGVAKSIEKHHYTPWLLDSFDLLLPLEPRQVLTLGSLPPDTDLEPLLQWDCSNPYRHWLVLTNSHPLLGERLYLLARHARLYDLTPEFDLTYRRPSLQHKREFFTKLFNCHQALPIWQSGIIFAFAFGIVLRCVFWLIGRWADQLNVYALTWLYNAHPFLNAWVLWVLIMVTVMGIFIVSHRFPHIFACAVLLRGIVWLIGEFHGDRPLWLQGIDPFFNAWVLIALSLSLIIRMNSYFPSLKGDNLVNNPPIAQFLQSPLAVPSDGLGVSLTGVLYGRQGMDNWLGQDLVLYTPSGLIQLRYTGFLGFIGQLSPWVVHLCQGVNQSVKIKGWLRRGSSPWIDLDHLQGEKRFILRGKSAIFLTIVALLAACWGACQIITL